MNCIYLLGGDSNDFFEDGYQLPKPLINVEGEELFYRVLSSTANINNKIFIGYNYNECGKHFFEEGIRKRFPSFEIFFVPIHRKTKGPAETLIHCLSHPEVNRSLPVISVDGDTIYPNGIEKVSPNSITTFSDSHPDPKFSYVKLNGNNIIEIKEKIKISDIASSGVYCFDSVESIFKAYELISSQSFYISDLINAMITNFNTSFTVHHLQRNQFIMMKTPHQLRVNSSLVNVNRQRYCFDLDGTIIAENGNFENPTLLPIVETIRNLKNKGHYIIIYTARGMVSCDSNIGKIIKKYSSPIVTMLEKFDIPFDEIYFGKPFADYYIDDKAVNQRSVNLNKILGNYSINSVIPRDFNRIETSSFKTIQKRSSDSIKMRAEIEWYKNCPPSIKKYIPLFVREIEMGYEIEKIEGNTFTQLLIEKNLKEEHLLNLITVIKSIHSLNITIPDDIDLKSNYTSKLEERMKKIDSQFIQEYQNLFDTTLHQLREYENSGLIRGSIVHGDPVFTNILLDTDEHIKLIDMRGMQSTKITIFGDALYDYAKIYQSLLGYDLIISDINVEDYSPILENFQNIFFKNIPPEWKKNIIVITNSLILSLLPLHSKSRWKSFVSLFIKTIII